MIAENNNTGQQQDVIADYADGLQQLEIQGYQKAVKKSRMALFWAGGLIFLGEMISMSRISGGFDLSIFCFAVIEAALFISLAFWTKTKPYTAVICGIIAFIGIILLNVVVSGLTEGAPAAAKALFGGIIIKIIILVNLVLPLKDAKELQAIKKNTV